MSLLLLMYALSFFTNDPVIDEKKWELYISTPDSIKIYRQENASSGLYFYKAECLVKGSPEKVFKAVINDDSYKQLNKYVVKEFKILTNNKNVWYKYTILNPPIINHRDYTLKYLIYEDSIKRNYQFSWKTDNNIGPKPLDGVVRINDLLGVIYISLSKKDGYSHLVYYIYIDPEGFVPSFFVNLLNKKSLPEFIRDIRKNSMKY